MRSKQSARILDGNANRIFVDEPLSGREIGGRSLDPDVFRSLGEARAESRGFDQQILATPGMNPSTRATQLAYPQPDVAPLGDPRKDRGLPGPTDVRESASDRQVRERAAMKRAVQEKLPGTTMAALQDFLKDSKSWRRINALLTRAHGDATLLGEKDRIYAGRLDRGIDAFERVNDRTHRVHVRMRLPRHINHSNIEGYLRNQIVSGRVFEFDRYAMAAHNLHEVAPNADDTERTVVMEIRTRRGMYLGGSHKGVGGTRHLLPRGRASRVTGLHDAPYERPDGSLGRTRVIQLSDIGLDEEAS